MSEYIAKCNEVVGISGKTLIVPDYIDTSKEIVRCRDCKHFRPMEGTALSCRLPHPQYGHLVQWQFAEPDGYCWRGERKEGGE